MSLTPICERLRRFPELQNHHRIIWRQASAKTTMTSALRGSGQYDPLNNRLPENLAEKAGREWGARASCYRESVFSVAVRALPTETSHPAHESPPKPLGEGAFEVAAAQSHERQLTGANVKDPPKRSRTQVDLDEAIREYKAERASTYYDLVDGVRRGTSGATKSARDLFGRNAIVRALGVTSAAMVSKSAVWQAIADELELRGPSRSTSRRPAQRIGLDIAIEDQA
jgi:hypothetical protein